MTRSDLRINFRGVGQTNLTVISVRSTPDGFILDVTEKPLEEGDGWLEGHWTFERVGDCTVDRT